jgi:hypothetical protein
MRVTDYQSLPYGVYLTRDNVIWYDRRYRPIAGAAWHHYCPACRTIQAGTLTPVEPDRWIDFEEQAWLYKDATFDRKTRARLRDMVERLSPLKAELIRRKAVLQ